MAAAMLLEKFFFRCMLMPCWSCSSNITTSCLHYVYHNKHVLCGDITWQNDMTSQSKGMYHMTITWPKRGGTWPHERASSHQNNYSLPKEQSSCPFRVACRWTTGHGTRIHRTWRVPPVRGAVHVASLHYRSTSHEKSHGRPWSLVHDTEGMKETRLRHFIATKCNTDQVGSHFPWKMSCLRWDSNPRHSVY